MLKISLERSHRLTTPSILTKSARENFLRRFTDNQKFTKSHCETEGHITKHPKNYILNSYIFDNITIPKYNSRNTIGAPICVPYLYICHFAIDFNQIMLL